MNEKVHCPWCGAEMYACYSRGKVLGEWKYYYDAHLRCTGCGAQGPFARWNTPEGAKEAAKAAALRRYTALLKPMTLEEVKDLRVGTLVWSEHIPKWRADDGMCVYNGNPGDGYGRLYRYWAGRKPTDEERSAAGWETI